MCGAASAECPGAAPSGTLCHNTPTHFLGMAVPAYVLNYPMLLRMMQLVRSTPHLCPLRVGGHQVVVPRRQALVARHMDHVAGLLLVQPAHHLELRLEGRGSRPGLAGAQLRRAGGRVRRGRRQAGRRSTCYALWGWLDTVEQGLGCIAGVCQCACAHCVGRGVVPVALYSSHSAVQGLDNIDTITAAADRCRYQAAPVLTQHCLNPPAAVAAALQSAAQRTSPSAGGAAAAAALPASPGLAPPPRPEEPHQQASLLLALSLLLQCWPLLLLLVLCQLPHLCLARHWHPQRHPLYLQPLPPLLPLLLLLLLGPPAPPTAPPPRLLAVQQPPAVLHPPLAEGCLGRWCLHLPPPPLAAPGT